MGAAQYAGLRISRQSTRAVLSKSCWPKCVFRRDNSFKNHIFAAEKSKTNLMEENYDYTAEEYKKLGDAIVWTAILAAVHKDGVIEEEERAEAIKQSHIRCFSTEDYIQPIYEHLDEHFERDFDAYTAMLPAGYDQKEAFIQSKLEASTAILKEMGPVFSAEFSRELQSFFNRVFNANTSVFQSFMFPFISGHLEDKNNPNK
jgi:hypothetical protein